MPKGGGRDLVGKPYVVAGRLYTPRDMPNYSAVGTASWYGTAFHGRRTANGEVFDRMSISAAHPTLPLPSPPPVVALALLAVLTPTAATAVEPDAYAALATVDLERGMLLADPVGPAGAPYGIRVDYQCTRTLPPPTRDGQPLAPVGSDAPPSAPSSIPRTQTPAGG